MQDKIGEENSLLVFDSDSDDPSNFQEYIKPVSGCRALWFSVLKDATVKYARGACLKHKNGTQESRSCKKCVQKRKSRGFQEALHWFQSKSEYVTTYKWICTVLNIDTTWLWEKRTKWSRVAQTGQRSYRRSGALKGKK